jgi:hypothetical protein
MSKSGSDVTEHPADLVLDRLLLALRVGRRGGVVALPVHALALLVGLRRGSDEAGRPSVLVSDLAQLLANHLRSKEEVVVVNDDEISRTPDLGDLLGEQMVGLVVCGPGWIG